MSGLVNHIVVTGPVDPESTGLVGSAPVAPPYPSLPCKGERCGGPTKMTQVKIANDIDKGPRPATLEPLTINMTEQHDNAPLRLRGGNDERNDDDLLTRMDIDTDNQTDSTNNIIKRFKPGSPESDSHKTAKTIESALNNVDLTLNNIRTYMSDMIAATKIGKKWSSGMEDFLTEILINTKKIALEAVEIIGVNKHTTEELKQAKTQMYKLHVQIGELSTNGNKKVNENQGRTYANATLGSKTDVSEGLAPPNRIANEPGEYPPIGKHKSKIKKISGKMDLDRINKAKKVPVKPTLRVRGTKDMDSLWKSIKRVLDKPRVDSAKKLPNGDILVISTDTDTMSAIKNISGKDGLEVAEECNRRPRVKIKNIPLEYSAEFIASSIMEQNPDLNIDTMSDVKPIFKCGPKNREVVDWVVEVTPSTYNKIANKRTFIGLMSTFPRPYVSASHCRRCLSLDHTTKNCKNDITCHHCATAGHEKGKCQKKGEAPTCAHCGGRHNTMGKECRTWAQRIRAVQRTTDYGTRTNNE